MSLWRSGALLGWFKISFMVCASKREPVNGSKYLYPEKYVNDGNESPKGLNFTFEWKESVII